MHLDQYRQGIWVAHVKMNIDQAVTVDLSKWIDQIVNVQNPDEVVAELHNLGIYRVEHLKTFDVEDVLKLGLRKYERQRFVAALQDIRSKRDKSSSPDCLDRQGSVSKQAERIHVELPHTSGLTDAEDSPDIIHEPFNLVSSPDSSPTATPHHAEGTDEQHTNMTGQPKYLDTHACVSVQDSGDSSERPCKEQRQVGKLLTHPLFNGQSVRNGGTEKEVLVEPPGNQPSNHPAEHSDNMYSSDMEADQLVHSGDTENDQVSDIGSDHTWVQKNVNKIAGSSKSKCVPEKIWFDNEPMGYSFPKKAGIVDALDEEISHDSGCSKATRIIKPMDGNARVYSSANVLENNHHQNAFTVASDGKESGSKIFRHSIHYIIGDQCNANKKTLNPSAPENRAKSQERETLDTDNTSMYHNLEQTNTKANCDQQGQFSLNNDSIVKPPLQPLPISHVPSESTGETPKDKTKRKDRERQKKKYEEIMNKKKEDPEYAAKKRREWKISKQKLRKKLKKNKNNEWLHNNQQSPVQNIRADVNHLIDAGVDDVSSTTIEQSHVNHPSRSVPVSKQNTPSLNATSTNPSNPEMIYEPVPPCPQPGTPSFPDTPVGVVCRNEIEFRTGEEQTSGNIQFDVVANAIKLSLNMDNSVLGLQYENVDHTHNAPSLSGVAQ